MRAIPFGDGDFTVAVEGVRDEGDMVVISAHFRGRNKSGAELDAEAEQVWEVRDGKLARVENKVDQEAWARGWS